MNSYRKGRLFEYSVRDLLIKSGFDVTRSSGSRGIKDLVAVKNGRVYYVQCKYNYDDALRFINEKKNKICDICEKYGVNFVVAYRPKPKSHKIKFIVVYGNKNEVLEDFSELSVEVMI